MSVRRPLPPPNQGSGERLQLPENTAPETVACPRAEETRRRSEIAGSQSEALLYEETIAKAPVISAGGVLGSRSGPVHAKCDGICSMFSSGLTVERHFHRSLVRHADGIRASHSSGAC